MTMFGDETPFKILIEDIQSFQKQGETWIYKVGAPSRPTIINNFQIQGEIAKTAGFFNEILIINDGTAKAKVTKGNQVPGDFSWIKEGVYCSVVGTLSNNGKLPHIAAIKIAYISNKFVQEMWPLEVLELKDVILNKVSMELLDV